MGLQDKKCKNKGTHPEYLCFVLFVLDTRRCGEREGSEVEFSPTPGAHTWAMLQNGGGGGTYGAGLCCFVLKWEIGVVVCVCVGGGGWLVW